MHGTCAIWQCRPVYRGFIVGPKGSRPNRQKFLYLHSCVFITPSPPSRYVVRSMNLNCELPRVFCCVGEEESSSKNDRTRERSCHESVKNLNFQKEISILWPRFDELRLFLYFPFPFDEYFASWFKILEKNILVDIWMVFY